MSRAKKKRQRKGKELQDRRARRREVLPKTGREASAGNDGDTSGADDSHGHGTTGAGVHSAGAAPTPGSPAMVPDGADETGGSVAPVYPQRRVEGPTDVVDLAAWFDVAARADEKFLMGISCTTEGVGLANKEQGWFIPTATLNGDNSALIKSTLTRMLTGRECAPLVAHDIEKVVAHLSSINVLDAINPRFTVYEFVDHFKHEMKALSWASGIRTPHNFPSPVMEALDACTVGPQMAIDIGNYYPFVGLPLAKHIAARSYENEGNKWSVTYPQLLLRVLAHYSREPFLIRLFTDHPDVEPLGAIAKHLDIDDRQETMSLLLWLAWDMDAELFMSQWRDRIVPEEAALLISDKVDKKLPVLRLWLTEEKQKVARDLVSQTLYGRPLRDTRPARLLSHTLLGSVHDIMNVAMVSLANNGSKNHLILNTTDTWERGVITGRTIEDLDEFEAETTFIAKLGDPLILPLGVKVHIGNE